MIKDSQENLNELNETYHQHMRIAFKPGLFKKTGSNQIAKMYELVSRN